MTLQEKLTTLRKQKGLSQDALADKLYVSRQAVYKWESGQTTPDIDKLRVLSSLYNVSIDNLLNDKEEIKYINAPASAPKAYGKVIRKKELRGKEADVHNLMLLPDEQKQHAARVKALKTIADADITAEMFAKDVAKSHSRISLAHVYEQLICFAMQDAGYVPLAISTNFKDTVSVKIHRIVSPLLKSIFSLEREGVNDTKVLTILGLKFNFRK